MRKMSLTLAAIAAVQMVMAPAVLAQGQPQQTGQPAGEQAQERSRGGVGVWLWPVLGLAVIGGAVAAASGGGGGGGGSSAPAGTQ